VNTTGTVNSYGSGGYATGNYNSTSTVAMPGGYSTYNIPYNVSRNDFFASYWHRQLPLKTKVPFAALVGMAGDDRNKEETHDLICLRIL
jgi:hypothetical protein